MESLWQATASLPRFKNLNKDINTDVLIIGGGMAGILCAYMMHQSGIDYVLAEASRICSGITGKTTAKITSQHGLVFDKIIQGFGRERAKQYLDANEAALKKYRELCSNIDCEFEEKDSFVYSLNSRAKIEREAYALENIGYEPLVLYRSPLPFSIAAAVRFTNQAQFNPFKFIAAISKGLNIFENTTVRELIGTTAVTDCGRIHAKRIIVATHFPFLNKHGSYFMKLYQHRSYVIALEYAPFVNGMFVDESKKGLSFRNYENFLLLGGGGHRTGKKGGNWDELRQFASRYYPNAIERYHWATQDCMTLDHVPYIGRYSASTDNLYVATGFNKWGMTSSMVSAMILTDIIQGKKNPYAEVFSPSRSMMHPQLATNAFEATVNLLTPTSKRCPHLGCALKWNSCEHTWDCPCHGSRFADDGMLIDNPSTDNIDI